VAANNGSALSDLAVQTDAYNWLTAGVMLAGRFATLAVALALAGTLARKPRNEHVTSGTFRTNSPLFGALLVATAIVVTALTFLPADALGPVAEHLLMRGGHTF
jgi:K+-transporting ATPase ATPase A chain